MATPVISVSDLNNLVRLLFDTTEVFQDVWIEGEISNLREYRSGNQLYFNLSDGDSQLNCVVFDSFRGNISFEPSDGQRVVARGKLKTFHKRGTYSLQVAYMALKGDGAMSKEFKELHDRLEQEGLFSNERKRPLPRFPKRVALITASESAAMHDFIRLSRESFPYFEITVLPATMQGASSPRSVQGALNFLNFGDLFDIGVIARGGGSAEDLSAFNDESLVRAIRSSKVPIITAIGHEVDTTLSDLASDFRAPTPTAAAQVLVAPFLDIFSTIRHIVSRSSSLATRRLTETQSTLKQSVRFIQQSAQQDYRFLSEKHGDLITRLTQANPLHKLGQGYSISKHKISGKVVRSISDISLGESLITELTDGQLVSRVETHHEIERDYPKNGILGR